MSIPKTTAENVREIAPGLYHWSVHDERIDFRSDAHAVAGQDGAVLVDPLPLAEEALASLGEIEAIVLTAASHQRAAWSLRERLGVPVYAPAGTREMEGEADQTYIEGDLLPGRLLAVRTPGPEPAHHALLRRESPSVLILGDLVMRSAEDEALQFVPPEYHESPEATRASVERIVEELDFEILGLAHGPPILDSPQEALRLLLG